MMATSGLEQSLQAQLRITAVTGWMVEYRFHPARRWRFDVAWPDQRLAVEIEGGVWTRGRHNRGAGFTGDCEKFSAAAILGWRVLRVTGEHIKNGQALTWITQALAAGEAKTA